ncbi:MAG TPA: four helix bundle protein [Candidatus Paceibacterota bacterium]|jgi:four helix bundle protein|nr:four helix bundle protein [Candidatus Paceibacterota bacterium]
MRHFEDIQAWQKAKALTVLIYEDFSTCKDFSFKNQIERASVSIMNNIAEGFERQTNKEFRNFLYIAKGSCGEVRSMLSVAKDLHYIHEKKFEVVTNLSLEVIKMISGLIKKL